MKITKRQLRKIIREEMRHLDSNHIAMQMIMEEATLPYLDLDVPLKVEGGHGVNWYLAH